MWQHLRLSSLGVIESAELELESGFSVITGETGAGKTMVVTALGLLRGERADAGLVRQGTATARIEASIAVPAGSDVARVVDDAGGEVEDGVVVLGRALSAQGRSRAFAGGTTVPASVLSEVTDGLVAVHGQSDQHRLLRASAQRDALDRFAGEPLDGVMARYRPAFERLRDVESRLDELTTHAQERARELDLLTHGLSEVDATAPEAGEDELLVAEEGRLAHAEALVRAAHVAHEALSGELDESSAHLRVAAASTALGEVTGHDPTLDALGQRVGELAVLLDDVATELASYVDTVEVDPARLAQVQERRAALTTLQRKYGPGLDDVLAWAEESRRRVADLDLDDDAIEALRAEGEELRARVAELAAELSAVRREAAGRLADLVGQELTQLAMPSARLEVDVRSPEGARPGPHGADEVELLFSANPGSAPRAVSKGASGGELSRLMLAIEVVLADRSTVPTMVFDEVDAGIGGGAAVEVGRRLAKLAEHVQVLAVTHLPQVAAFADHHFHVAKSDDGSITRSSVVELTGQDRVEELARMLAGQEDSATAKAHATELLQAAGHRVG